MAEPLEHVVDPSTPRTQRAAELWRNFRFGLAYSWRAGRARTATVVAVPLLESLIPAALALLLRGLVNATLRDPQAAGGWSIERYVVVSLTLSVALAVAQSLQLYLSQSNTEALEHRMAVDQITHAAQLDFGRFERPEFQDTLAQVRLLPGHHVHEMVAKCVRATAVAITVVSLLVILAAIEPLLLVGLLPLTVPYLLYRSWVARTRYHVQFAQNRSRRWIEYFTRHATNAEVLPEVRALDLEPLYVEQVGARLADIRRDNRRSFRMELVGSAGFNSLAVLLIHLALLSAANRAADGSLTPGDIAIFAGAATGLRSAIDAFVAGVGSLRWHLSHLAHLRAFFALEPERAAPVVAGRRSTTPDPVPAADPVRSMDPVLSMEDVTFSYPASARPVLDGLSLSVGAGETVGLVGRNGSGKSTVVKLINGLYPPDGGHIELCGFDVAQADRQDLRACLSTVFQTVVQHNATARDNIAMGDWRRLLDDPQQVEEIARRVGLDGVIGALPDGFDTVVGRTFGDVSLSGGQWQTFAIARAFAKNAPLMILDEPTASLDPEAEFEVFQRFKELAAGRATLLISHRFSTLALADRIVVLHDGRAEEQGTHEELLARGGTYAHLHRLFRLQGERGVWDDPGADPGSTG